MTKVSIIVPIYNTEKYLRACIDSLLSQTLKDIEIILINDGSPGNAGEIVKSYKDKRIKYIEKENTGIGSTRNLGIEKATGEYLMFIDSDDYIAKECSEKMYKKAVDDGLDLVVSNYYKDLNGKITEIKFKSFENSSLKENPSIINNINLGPCNKLYKRELFNDPKNRFIEHLKYEDAPFVCRVMRCAKKIGKLDECLSYYVIHEKSETTIRDKRIFDIIETSKLIIEDYKKYDYLKESLTNIIVMILTDYTIQQRYIQNKQDRNKFIDNAFKLLNDLDKDWKKCSYLKRFILPKRIVKTNKTLTKIYCDLYIFKHGKDVSK